AGKLLVLAVRKKRVQGVAKLVEERAHFVERQQRRLGRGRFGEVADNADVGAVIAAGVLELVAVARAPSAAALGLAREEVRIEEAFKGAGAAIGDLVNGDVGVVDR